MLRESALLSAWVYLCVLHHAVSWLDRGCVAAYRAGEFGTVAVWG